MKNETGKIPVERNLSCMFPLYNPANEHMSSECARLASFQLNPAWREGNIFATSDDMVKAGFFYVGRGDRVRCWYCNGGLEFWEYDDDPWIEHAKWYPDCEFTLRHKGPDFVSDVVSQFPNLSRPDPAKVRSAPCCNTENSWTSAVTRENHENSGNDISIPQKENEKEYSSRSVMQRSRLVEQAMNMGFTNSNIMEAFRRRRNDKNGDFWKFDDMLNILNVIQIEERREATVSSFSSDNIQSPEPTSAESDQVLQRLQDERTCKVCFENVVNVVFTPCRHLSTCEVCAQKVTTCPMCRSHVRNKMKVYLS